MRFFLDRSLTNSAVWRGVDKWEEGKRVRGRVREGGTERERNRKRGMEAGGGGKETERQRDRERNRDKGRENHRKIRRNIKGDRTHQKFYIL